MRTRQVLQAAEDAQNAGAAGDLLAPVSYQPLTDGNVFALFEEVTANLSVPLVIYGNPGTTHFTSTDELYTRLAWLPQVASIEIPALPTDPEQARARVEHLRRLLPETVTVGISGDAAAARGAERGMRCLVFGGRRHLPAAGPRPHPRGTGGAARAGRTGVGASPAPAGPVRPARRLPARRRGGRTVIPAASLTHATALAVAVLLYPHAHPAVTAALLVASGLFGSLLTGGISSRLPAIAGHGQRRQRRAQGWDVAIYGISGTVGPTLVAALAAWASPATAAPTLAAGCFITATVIRFLPYAPAPGKAADVPRPSAPSRASSPPGPCAARCTWP
ncbi:dihydrodipicolinate synthase family protein [Streptomyces roseolus]|uniref:dihydrodipicolinate synthase family protein n=1 Tax=Streptomyces roseolus TaxID=67358 RepID=UPI0037A0043A